MLLMLMISSYPQFVDNVANDLRDVMLLHIILELGGNVARREIYLQTRSEARSAPLILQFLIGFVD